MSCPSPQLFSRGSGSLSLSLSLSLSFSLSSGSVRISLVIRLAPNGISAKNDRSAHWVYEKEFGKRECLKLLKGKRMDLVWLGGIAACCGELLSFSRLSSTVYMWSGCFAPNTCGGSCLAIPLFCMCGETSWLVEVCPRVCECAFLHSR